MPIFTYKCGEHGIFQKMLPSRVKTFECPKCGEISQNQFKVGSVQTMEILDNGLMARAVERLSDIEEIVSLDNDKFTKKNLTEEGEEFIDD